MTMQNTRLTLDEVLNKFFYASEKPDAEKLKEVLAAYPEYREDIVEFTTLWASYENSEDSSSLMVPSEVPAENITQLQSFVMGRLHKLNHEAVSEPGSNEVSSAKNALNRLAGSSLRRAAVEAGFFGSTILLTKILTKKISDIPKRALVGLAQHLNINVETLIAVLQETQLGTVRSYKSTYKPEVAGAESWKSAVNKLSLTPEQKKTLLALSDEGKES